jgi:hypothetical protein
MSGGWIGRCFFISGYTRQAEFSRTAFTAAINPICKRELISAAFVKLLDFRVFQQYRRKPAVTVVSH